MRDLPITERDDSAIQARFEQLAPGIQASDISVAISAASWAAAGAKVAGPYGAAAGAVVGALIGFWNKKAYREQAYAQMKAEGLLQTRSLSKRGVLDLHLNTYSFARLPYSNLTALVIVPILKKNHPDMSEEDLRAAGRGTQRSLIAFRKEYPDIPIELAAEVVLAYYGIIREPGQDYALASKPKPGEPYKPPPIRPPSVSPPVSPPISPPPEKKKKNPIFLYIVVGVIVILILSDE